MWMVYLRGDPGKQEQTTTSEGGVGGLGGRGLRERKGSGSHVGCAPGPPLAGQGAVASAQGWWAVSGSALSMPCWRRLVRVAPGSGRGLAPCLLYPAKLDSRSSPLWGSPTFQVVGHSFLWTLWPLLPQQGPFSRSPRCTKRSAQQFASVD